MNLPHRPSHGIHALWRGLACLVLVTSVFLAHPPLGKAENSLPLLVLDLSQDLEQESSLERDFLLREIRIRLQHQTRVELGSLYTPAKNRVRIHRPNPSGAVLLDLLDEQNLILRTRAFTLMGLPDDNLDVARIVAELVQQSETTSYTEPLPPPPITPKPTPEPIETQPDPPLPNYDNRGAETIRLQILARGGGGYVQGGMDGFGQIGMATEFHLVRHAFFGFSLDYETPYTLKLDDKRFTHQAIVPAILVGYAHPLRRWLNLRLMLFAEDRVVYVETDIPAQGKTLRWSQNLAGGMSLGTGFTLGSFCITLDLQGKLSTRQVHRLEDKAVLDTGLFRVYALAGIGYGFSL